MASRPALLELAQLLPIVTPLVGELAKTIIHGIASGKSNAEIREAITRGDIVSDDALNKLRASGTRVRDFIENGG